MTNFMSRNDINIHTKCSDILVDFIDPKEEELESAEVVMRHMGFSYDLQNDIFYQEDRGAVIEPICLCDGKSLRDYMISNKHKIDDLLAEGYELTLGHSVLTDIIYHQDGFVETISSDYSLCCVNYQELLDNFKVKEYK